MALGFAMLRLEAAFAIKLCLRLVEEYQRLIDNYIPGSVPRRNTTVRTGLARCSTLSVNVSHKHNISPRTPVLGLIVLQWPIVITTTIAWTRYGGLSVGSIGLWNRFMQSNKISPRLIAGKASYP